MAKKKSKKNVFVLRPWCWYCEREFEDEKVLLQHQKAKHFKCGHCPRKLNTAGGLMVHCQQVHKMEPDKLENTLPGRDGYDVEIFGMEGIPPKDASEWRTKKEQESGIAITNNLMQQVNKRPRISHAVMTEEEAGKLLAVHRNLMSGKGLPGAVVPVATPPQGMGAPPMGFPGQPPFPGFGGGFPPPGMPGFPPPGMGMPPQGFPPNMPFPPPGMNLPPGSFPPGARPPFPPPPGLSPSTNPSTPSISSPYPPPPQGFYPPPPGMQFPPTGIPFPPQGMGFPPRPPMGMGFPPMPPQFVPGQGQGSPMGQQQQGPGASVVEIEEEEKVVVLPPKDGVIWPDQDASPAEKRALQRKYRYTSPTPSSSLSQPPAVEGQEPVGGDGGRKRKAAADFLD